MKKQKTKWILPICLLFPLFLLSGCKNMFIPQDVPIVIEEKKTFNQSDNESIEIQSYSKIADGFIQDISYNGNALLLQTIDTNDLMNTIDLYNTETNQVNLFLKSDKEEVFSQFDSNTSGVYYIEENVDPLTNKINRQLLWTDLNKDITRIISIPEENVNANFGIGDLEKVIYTNTRGEIILSDNQGNRQIYTTSRNFIVSSISYLKSTNIIVFLSQDPSNEEKTNLYFAEIPEDSNILNIKLIDENVTYFSLNNPTEKLIYVKKSGDFQTISTWDFKTLSTVGVSSGNYKTAQFTPNGDKIIYTLSPPSQEAESSSIWLMDVNGKNQLQITSPIKLNSQVICHPFKSTLYFSTETEESFNYLTKAHTLSEAFQINYEVKQN
ncbi:MAG: hypothetical protein ACRCU3_02935 [Eubacteriaceae bacterium]